MSPTNNPSSQLSGNLLNSYHPNGAPAYDKAAGKAYFNNGNVAYERSTSMVYHDNRVVAYDKTDGKVYYDNASVAYDRAKNTFYDHNGFPSKPFASISLGVGVDLQLVPSIEVIACGTHIAV